MAQERILVVDDEASVRQIVAALLEHQGYDAVTADGGRARRWIGYARTRAMTW